MYEKLLSIATKLGHSLVVFMMCLDHGLMKNLHNGSLNYNVLILETMTLKY